jgi:hypothetical protein
MGSLLVQGGPAALIQASFCHGLFAKAASKPFVVYIKGALEANAKPAYKRK